MTSSPQPAVAVGTTGDTLAERRAAENFPVALRLLPRDVRHHLVAVYDVARRLDDLGDEADGDRVQLLTAFGRDLERVWDGGEPDEEVLRRLVPTVRAVGLAPEPFRLLLEANLQDQRVTRYATFPELRDYCRLSAEPVGHLVLQVFGAAQPERLALSGDVCTALQLLEHWQDVGEDRQRGRVYLPQEDLEAFGVDVADLDARSASPALRALLAFQTRRAEALLAQGAPLVRMLSGGARLAVAGYVAGGRATVAALRRADLDVLRGAPRPRRRDVATQAVRLLVGGAR